MWTSEITEKVRENGSLRIRVKFTNGTNTVEELYSVNFSNPDINWLKRQVANKILALNNIDSFDASLTLGTFDSTIVDPTPSQEDLDKKKFMFDYGRWLSVKKAIDAGILTGNEVPVQNLLNLVKSEFKATYLSEL